MSDEKRKSSQLSPAAQVLQTLLQSSKSPLSEQFIRWRLWNSWEDVVGPEIAKHTLPVSYLNGTLYVWVKSAARMQELTFLVRPILKKVNDFAGKKWIRSIRFTLDRKSVPRLEHDTAQEMRQFLSKSRTEKDSD